MKFQKNFKDIVKDVGVIKKKKPRKDFKIYKEFLKGGNRQKNYLEK